MDTITLTPTMGRITQTMHNLMHASLPVAALMLLLPPAISAQINMRQMPGYSGTSNSSAVANRSKTDAPVVMQATTSMAISEDIAKLRLAPGFLVSLNVLDDSDFTGSFRIDEQGNLTLPILGAIHLAGKTISEARVQIQQKLLEDKILKDPQVILTMLEYAAPEVTIIGEVASPGKYPLLVPRKLVDVLALAGGPTTMAGNEIQIISGSEGGEPVQIRYSKSTNPREVEDVIVHSGDTVQVKRAGIVYVLGAVNRPGGYVMQEDGTLNVLQAISLASGTSIAASTKTIYLLRRNADGTEVNISLPYKKMIHGKHAGVQLHATDMLFVPTSTFKAVLTNSQLILSSAASATIYTVAR